MSNTETDNSTEKKAVTRKAKKKRTLDELFSELEAVTTELEAQELPLEEAFAKYRKGMELLKECNEAIDTVEKELQILEEA
ncbi:MAG: exodeoxyribonuclease VII small subunit [Lachnospiraceae bacterium]|nr:exodeoxyribonuclease VII small subunit [Lachnospiraceae bacterium]